jgi:exonuclease SbcD
MLAGQHDAVAIYPIPYLEPAAVPPKWQLTERSHTAAMSAAMQRIRSDLAGRPGARSVVMAHAFVTGGAGSDSERDISVGGVSNVPADLFDGIDYVALGHLHRPQRLTDHIRYSGSPLAYSFSEAGQTKGYLLVDLGQDGLPGVEFIPAPPARRLVNLVGKLEELLTDPRYEQYEDWLVRVVLTDTEQLWAPGDQLGRRFRHLLVLETSIHGLVLPEHGLEQLARMDPMQVATEFVEQMLRRGATAEETALLRRAFEQVRLDDQEIAEVSS